MLTHSSLVQLLKHDGVPALLLLPFQVGRVALQPDRLVLGQQRGLVRLSLLQPLPVHSCVLLDIHFED